MGQLRSLKRKAVKIQGRNDTGTITATLEDVLNSVGPNPQIPGALSILCSQSIPIVLSFGLLKVAEAVNKEWERYQKTRQLLCERYANKDSEGKAIMVGLGGSPFVEGQPGKYEIPDPSMPEFNKELAELGQAEVAIPGRQVRVSELANVTIAPAHLMALTWLIVDG